MEYLPKAELYLPVVLDFKELAPTAVLSHPEVLETKAFCPMATF